MSIHKLMTQIVQEVPEVANRHTEVLALIKTYLHEEKHVLWNNYRKQFKLSPEEKRFVDAKVETHWVLADYKENLQWAKRYGRYKRSKQSHTDETP